MVQIYPEVSLPIFWSNKNRYGVILLLEEFYFRLKEELKEGRLTLKSLTQTEAEYSVSVSITIC